MPPEQNEQDRREMIRRLEEEERRLDAEAAHLDGELAKAKRAKLSVQAALVRAYEPPLSNDVCLACWINHGNEVRLVAVAHPEPARFDRWICGACENVVDQKTGLR